MVAAIATGLVTLAVLLRGTTTAGQIGMALNIVLAANATLLGLVESWTNLEISLGAMYADLYRPILSSPTPFAFNYLVYCVLSNRSVDHA